MPDDEWAHSQSKEVLERAYAESKANWAAHPRRSLLLSVVCVTVLLAFISAATWLTWLYQWR